ncbi:MAG: tRNA threonylcarbamoyladenosine dehydratase [Bacilli bacterium]
MVNNEQFNRFDSLIGKDNRKLLFKKKVAIFGLGGVGSAAAISLARAGVGCFYLFDFDVVEPSNINRQMLAFHSTIGKKKTAVLREIIADINPKAEIKVREDYLTPELIDEIDFTNFDFVVDAIDTPKSKIALIKRGTQLKVPLISALGAGNRLDPSQLRIMDIYETRNDPFAKIIRSLCRKQNISHLTVVASVEKPIATPDKTLGSSPFVPPAMGLLMASYVVKKIIGECP